MVAEVPIMAVTEQEKKSSVSIYIYVHTTQELHVKFIPTLTWGYLHYSELNPRKFIFGCWENTH